MRKKYNTPHRSRVVKTRLSEDEYADFTARLAPYGISQSEFLRQAIRRATIRPVVHVSSVNDELLSAVGKLTCFSSSSFPHFHHHASPSSSWKILHFQQVLSGCRFHYCILPHEGVFHPVASPAGHQEMAVVGQPVNHGGCHLFIGEDAAPFRELQVRRQDEALALVAV